MLKPVADVRGLELKAVLVGVEPPIWRRLQVPLHLTLAKLHRVLQPSFGWLNTHLHEFRVGEVRFGMPSEEGPSGIDDRKVSLADLDLRPGRKVRYLYDFGDGWEIELTVTGLCVVVPAVPSCLEGERAGPPDDSGGPWGYSESLKALADPGHPEHDDRKEWIGEDWDPEAFDLDQLNAKLRRIR